MSDIKGYRCPLCEDRFFFIESVQSHFSCHVNKFDQCIIPGCEYRVSNFKRLVDHLRNISDKELENLKEVADDGWSHISHTIILGLIDDYPIQELKSLCASCCNFLDYYVIQKNKKELQTFNSSSFSDYSSTEESTEEITETDSSPNSKEEIDESKENDEQKEIKQSWSYFGWIKYLKIHRYFF